jgi:hypothetical protein
MVPALDLGGEVLSPIVFTNFPWVSIMEMGVAVSLSVPEMVPEAAEFHATTTLLGATATVAFVLDPGAGLFGEWPDGGCRSRTQLAAARGSVLPPSCPPQGSLAT